MASTLPEPYNMQTSVSLDDKFVVEFSRAMANQIIAYAGNNNSTMLHAIVGLMHEPQICYFIENNCKL
jgi:hypothetical protein